MVALAVLQCGGACAFLPAGKVLYLALRRRHGPGSRARSWDDSSCRCSPPRRLARRVGLPARRTGGPAVGRVAALVWCGSCCFWSCCRTCACTRRGGARTLRISPASSTRSSSGWRLRAVTSPGDSIAVAPRERSHISRSATAWTCSGVNDSHIAHEPPKTARFHPGHTKWDYPYSIARYRPTIVYALYAIPTAWGSRHWSGTGTSTGGGRLQPEPRRLRSPAARLGRVRQPGDGAADRAAGRAAARRLRARALALLRARHAR